MCPTSPLQRLPKPWRATETLLDRSPGRGSRCSVPFGAVPSYLACLSAARLAVLSPTRGQGAGGAGWHLPLRPRSPPSGPADLALHPLTPLRACAGALSGVTLRFQVSGSRGWWPFPEDGPAHGERELWVILSWRARGEEPELRVRLRVPGDPGHRRRLPARSPCPARVVQHHPEPPGPGLGHRGADTGTRGAGCARLGWGAASWRHLSAAAASGCPRTAVSPGRCCWGARWGSCQGP